MLAERQYGIAHFYFLRDNMAASQARLKSLSDSYPLYSKMDEALFTLGNIYQREANAVRNQKNIPDANRERTVAELEKNAIEAYSRIITRYPAMGRADDARKKLAELKAPIPTPTAEAIAASKAEEESREEMGRFGRLVGNFRKHPNVALAAKAGEPSMEDEQVDSPVAFMKHIESSMKGEAAAPVANNKLGVETISPGNGAAPGPNQPIPGSGTATQSDTTPTAPPQVNDVGSTSQANSTHRPCGISSSTYSPPSETLSSSPRSQASSRSGRTMTSAHG